MEAAERASGTQPMGGVRVSRRGDDRKGALAQNVKVSIAAELAVCLFRGI